MYKYNAIPMKISIIFFRVRTNDLKTCVEHERPWIAKMILKKNKTGELALPDFKTSYRVIPAVWHGHEDTESPQNTTESPERSPCAWRSSHLWQGCPDHAGERVSSASEARTLDPYLTPGTKTLYRDQGPLWKPKTSKILRRRHGARASQPWAGWGH